MLDLHRGLEGRSEHGSGNCSGALAQRQLELCALDRAKGLLRRADPGPVLFSKLELTSGRVPGVHWLQRDL